jgi:cytidylate kinase
MARTIAISSTYGSGGEAIGREVAARLGTQFFDRAIPIEVARELAVELKDAFEYDWNAPGRIDRVLDALGSVAMPYAMEAGVNFEPYANAETFRRATESVLRSIADGPGGVLLGRASAIVLQGRPDVLSVRLDAPVDARIRDVIQRRGIDEAAARRDQREVDAARGAYARTFYGRSLDDPRLFHLMLDSTALSRDACVEIVITAADDRFAPK